MRNLYFSHVRRQSRQAIVMDIDRLPSQRHRVEQTIHPSRHLTPWMGYCHIW